MSTTPLWKRRWFRITSIAVGCVLLTLLLIVLLLPTYISSGSGTRWALGFVNNSIKGSIAVDDLSVGWTHGPTLENVRVLDAQGELVAQIERVTAKDASLWRLARGSRDLGKVRVIRPEADLVQREDGTLNLAEALSPVEPSPEEEKPAGEPLKDLRLDFALENGRISYVAPGIEPMTVTDLSLAAVVDTVQRIELNAKAQFEQANQRGHLDAQATLTDLLDAAGAVQYDAGRIEASADLVEFPIVAADRLANQNGKLVELLGDKLTATVKSQGQIRNLQASIDARSKHLAMDTKLAARDGNFAIDPDSKVELEITPQAWEALVAKEGESPTKLVEPFKITLTINELTGRIVNNALDRRSVKAIVTANVGDIVLDAGAALGTLAMRGTQGMVRFNGPEDQHLEAELRSVAHHGQNQGEIALNADVLHALTPDGAFNRTGYKATVNGGITRWPLPLFDELMQLDGLLAQAIGPTLDATVHANIGPADDDSGLAGTLGLKANAQQLQVDVEADIARNTLTVHDNSLAQLTVTRELVARYGQSLNPPIALAADARPLTATVRLAGTRIPLTSAWATGALQVRADVSDGQFIVGAAPAAEAVALAGTQATITAEDLTKALQVDAQTQLDYRDRRSPLTLKLSATDPLLPSGATNRQKMKAHLEATFADLPAALIDALQSLGGKAQAALGDAVTVQLVADATPIPNAETGFDTTFTLTASAPDHLTAEVKGRHTSDRFQLNRGGSVTYVLRQELLNHLQEQPMQLAQPATVKVQLDQINIPLPADEQTLRQAQVGLSAAIDALALAATEAMPAVSLRNVELTVEPTPLNKPLVAKLTGDIASESGAGKLNASATVQDPLAPMESANVTVDIAPVPVALVDQIAGQGGLLTELLGQSLRTVKLSADTKPDQPIRFKADIDSPLLKVDIGGQYHPADRSVQFNDGAAAEYQVTPQAFPHLAPAAAEAGLSLVNPATLRLEIAQFATVLREADEAASADPEAPKPLPIEPARTAIRATLRSTSPLAFRVPDLDTPQGLTQLNVAIQTPSLTEQVQLDATGNFVSYDAGGKARDSQPFHSKTVVRQPYTADGMLNTAALSLNTDTSVQNANSALVVTLAGLDMEYARALGPTVSIVARGDYPGRLEATAMSKNLQLRAPLVADESRTLTLFDDLTGQLAINSDTRVLLGRMSPMLVDASDANEPARLRIAREGFMVPLGEQPFDIAKAKMAGTLELNQVTLNQSWVVKEYAGIVGGLAGGFTKTLGGIAKTAQDLLGLIGKESGNKSLQAPAQALAQVTAYTDRLERLTGGATPYQFTPVIFQLQDGVLRTEDTWMRSPDLMIGVRGNFNLANKGVDAKLGIPGRSLTAPMPMLSKLGVIDPNKIHEFRVVRAGEGEHKLEQQDKNAFLKTAGDVFARVTSLFDRGSAPAETVTSALRQLPPDWQHMPEWPEARVVESEPTQPEPAPDAPPQEDVISRPREEEKPAPQEEQPPAEKPRERQRDPVKRLEDLLGL